MSLLRMRKATLSRPSVSELSRSSRVRPPALGLGTSLGAAPYSAALFLLALMALGALARTPYWHRPVGFDGGQYLYVGQVILDGGTPYTDAANNKGPALFLTFALIRLVSGDSTLAVRLIALLFVALAALALAAYVGKHLGRPVGLLAGVLLVIITAAPGINGRYLYAENFALTPMVGAMWLASRGGKASTAGAGALAATSALMHIPFALIAPFLAAEVVATADRDQRIRNLSLALAGALAATAPVLLWIAASGAFPEMIEQVGGKALRSVGVVDQSLALLEFPLEALTAVGIVGALTAVRDSRTRVFGILAAAWIVAIFLRVKVSSYTFPQHFYPAAPAIAAGIALALFWRNKIAALLAMVATLVALWIALEPVVDEVTSGEPPGADYPDYGEVADFIRSHTEPDESIYASYPEVFWLADRRAPTRFFDHQEIQAAPSFERERNDDLLRNPPRAIVVDDYAYQDSYLAPLTARYEYDIAFQNREAAVLVLKHGR